MKHVFYNLFYRPTTYTQLILLQLSWYLFFTEFLILTHRHLHNLESEKVENYLQSLESDEF